MGRDGAMAHDAHEPSAAGEAPKPGLALLPLGIAVTIALLLTVYPPIVSRADGHADHLAATLLMAAMSAGFVRGVGFLPRSHVLRAVFSTAACLWLLVLAVVVIAGRAPTV